MILDVRETHPLWLLYVDLISVSIFPMDYNVQHMAGPSTLVHRGSVALGTFVTVCVPNMSTAGEEFGHSLPGTLVFIIVSRLVVLVGEYGQILEGQGV